MKILKPDFDLDTFFQKVAGSEKRLLLLDYDGTLAPFKINREEAVPYPGMREAIQAIIDTRNSRLVLISGRSIPDLVPLLKFDPLPEIWGSHGWERLLPGNDYKITSPDKPAIEALDVVQAILDGEGLRKHREKKPGCLALHWRGLESSEIKKLRGKFLDKWSNIASKFDLSLSGTICAYLGDDTTDEDAFRTLDEDNLSVLVRPEYRPTEANIWIQPPDEVLDFLDRWATASSNPDDSRTATDPLRRPADKKGDPS
jgi:trehalose-6-phosphatase